MTNKQHKADGSQVRIITESTDHSHKGNWYVLICGLPSSDELLTLAPGISLRRLQEPLTVLDLAAVGAAGFREWAMLEPLASSCATEIESAKDSDILPGYDTLGRVWLASALLNLRGFGGHLCVACNGYSWNLIAGHQRRTKSLDQKYWFPAKFCGQLLEFQYRYIKLANQRTDLVNKADAAWIRQQYAAFNDLAAKSERFRFALQAASDWRFSRDERIAMARLWSGIEALFAFNFELSFRLSASIAALLKPFGLERRSLFQEIKKIYNVRSKAVHGDSISSDVIYAAIQRSHEVLCDLLLYFASLGRDITDKELDEGLFGFEAANISGVE